MGLLFDQNISYRVLKELVFYFPNSKQVQEVGLEGKSDREIWKWAKANAFTIVSFDSDFVDLSMLMGFPPKVIWLRLGNSSTSRIAKEFLEKEDEIKDFLKNENEGILKVESAF